MNVWVAVCVSWASLAAGVWAVAWAHAPWWGVLIALCVAGMFGMTAKTGLATLTPEAQLAYARKKQEDAA